MLHKDTAGRISEFLKNNLLNARGEVCTFCCLHISKNIMFYSLRCRQRAGIAQLLERRTRDSKVAGSNPCWSGGRIFFSRVDFLCLLLFRYPFHPRVTAVARKRSWSLCQKCRWQVTAKQAFTLRMWLCMKWHGAWLYGVHRTRRDGCSFMWHQLCQRCKYTTSVDIQKTRYKASHSCRTTCERSESAQESGE